MFVFDFVLISFRIAWWPSTGKELSRRLSALAVFILCHLGCVCSFPIVRGRMWNSIVSVPDLCLFIYLGLNLGKKITRFSIDIL